MSHHSKPDKPFPLFPLLGAGSLVLVSLVSVAWVRWFAEPDPGLLHQQAVVQAKSLYFVDQPAGEVEVVDADTGELVSVLAIGEHGFIRSTLRGLARARRARGLGSETPFLLEKMENGQLLLVDPVTGQRIDLWAFGESNARSFAEFLESPPLAVLPVGNTEHQTAQNAAMASSIEVEYSQ